MVDRTRLRYGARPPLTLDEIELYEWAEAERLEMLERLVEESLRRDPPVPPRPIGRIESPWAFEYRRTKERGAS